MSSIRCSPLLHMSACNIPMKRNALGRGAGGVDLMCFSGSGPTHFLRWIVYYCICIQQDIDKSQISFIELCKTLRTNSDLRAINSCLHLFWPQLCNRNICAVSYVYACVCFVTADYGVWTHPHFYTDLCPCPLVFSSSKIMFTWHVCYTSNSAGFYYISVLLNALKIRRPTPRYYRNKSARSHSITAKLVPVPAVLPWTLFPLPRSNRGYRGKTVILIPVQLSILRFSL